MEKKKVIVCGTTFGRYYLEAVRNRSDIFELAGIFAGGSERSRQLAESYGLPLYTKAEDIPDGIDIACVVIRSDGCGSVGTTIAVELMGRGINVIAEQPVHKSFLTDSFKAAAADRVCYQTADLYAHLPSTKAFLKAASKLNEKMHPVYIRASFSTQVSFPAMEILTESTGIRDMLKVDCISSETHPFTVLSGHMGNVPITLEFQNELCPSDPDAFMQLLHEFTIFYPSGRLVYSDTMGSVVYRPRIYVPKNKYSGDSDGMEQPAEIVLYRKEETTFFDEVNISWVNAIADDLAGFSERIDRFRTSGKTDKRGAKEIRWAEKWEELHRIFGFSKLAERNDYQFFTMEQFDL